MIRTNVFEDKEATMTSFLNGLNKDIVNVVELHHYLKIKDMVHITIKVEKQLEKKNCAKPASYLGSFQGWKSNFKKKSNA